MILVLRSDAEVEEALSELERARLPLHVTPQKNWDHMLIRRLLRERKKDIRILDVGSGDGYTLEFLHFLGFENIEGLDLTVPWRHRLKKLFRIKKSEGFCATDLIRRGDMCSTGLPDGSIDVITAVSVIEHSVPKKPFLAECSRLLKLNGLLFITTDYWEHTEQKADKSVQLFSLDWTIQNKEMIQECISWADEVGLELVEKGAIPETEGKTVSYYGYDYTFIALGFTKRQVSGAALSDRVCVSSS